jgi:hypothetical protein
MHLQREAVGKAAQHGIYVQVLFGVAAGGFAQVRPL